MLELNFSYPIDYIHKYDLGYKTEFRSENSVIFSYINTLISDVASFDTDMFIDVKHRSDCNCSNNVLLSKNNNQVYVNNNNFNLLKNIKYAIIDYISTNFCRSYNANYYHSIDWYMDKKNRDSLVNTFYNSIYKRPYISNYYDIGKCLYKTINTTRYTYNNQFYFKYYNLFNLSILNLDTSKLYNVNIFYSKHLFKNYNITSYTYNKEYFSNKSYNAFYNDNKISLNTNKYLRLISNNKFLSYIHTLEEFIETPNLSNYLNTNLSLFNNQYNFKVLKYSDMNGVKFINPTFNITSLHNHISSLDKHYNIYNSIVYNLTKDYRKFSIDKMYIINVRNRSIIPFNIIKLNSIRNSVELYKSISTKITPKSIIEYKYGLTTDLCKKTLFFVNNIPTIIASKQLFNDNLIYIKINTKVIFNIKSIITTRDFSDAYIYIMNYLYKQYKDIDNKNKFIIASNTSSNFNLYNDVTYNLKYKNINSIPITISFNKFNHNVLSNLAFSFNIDSCKLNVLKSNSVYRNNTNFKLFDTFTSFMIKNIGISKLDYISFIKYKYNSNAHINTLDSLYSYNKNIRLDKRQYTYIKNKKSTLVFNDIFITKILYPTYLLNSNFVYKILHTDFKTNELAPFILNKNIHVREEIDMQFIKTIITNINSYIFSNKIIGFNNIDYTKKLTKNINVKIFEAISSSGTNLIKSIYENKYKSLKFIVPGITINNLYNIYKQNHSCVIENTLLGYTSSFKSTTITNLFIGLNFSYKHIDIKIDNLFLYKKGYNTIKYCMFKATKSNHDIKIQTQSSFNKSLIDTKVISKMTPTTRKQFNIGFAIAIIELLKNQKNSEKHIPEVINFLSKFIDIRTEDTTSNIDLHGRSIMSKNNDVFTDRNYIDTNHKDKTISSELSTRSITDKSININVDNVIKDINNDNKIDAANYKDKDIKLIYSEKDNFGRDYNVLAYEKFKDINVEDILNIDIHNNERKIEIINEESFADNIIKNRTTNIGNSEYYSVRRKDLETSIPHFQQLLSDPIVRDIICSNDIYSAYIPRPYDDFFQNFVKGGIDELLLPQGSFDYTKFQSMLYDENTQSFNNVISRIDDTTIISKFPTNSPLPEYDNLVTDYVDINVQMLKHMIEIFYTIWQQNIFKFGGMDLKEAVSKMLEYMEVVISYRVAEAYETEGKRLLKLFAWYGEAAILKHSEYVVHIKYNSLKSDMHTGQFNIPYEIMDNLVLDTTKYILKNINTNIDSQLVIHLSNVIESNISFNVGISNGVLQMYINDTLIDTIFYWKLATFVIPKMENNTPNEIKLIFKPQNNGIINIGNMIIDNYKVEDFETEYKPVQGSGNIAINDTFKRLAIYTDILDKNSDFIDTIIENNLALSDIVDRLIEYFKQHHLNKAKGKRLTIQQ